MKIFTGNFANIKKYANKNIHSVSIALTARYFNGDLYRSLNPKWEFKDDPEPEYKQKYLALLSNLDAKKVYDDLMYLSKGKDVVLLCHEKEGDFCHRRLVAQWLERELNIEVKELGKMEEKQMPIFAN